MILISAVLTAYFIGSIPTSFIIAKLSKGVDIRNYGSGNVGATNVYRVVGKLPGIFALLIDIAKGVLVVTVIAAWFRRIGITLEYETFRMLMGLVAIAGHDWPVWLRFKGGKGIATSAGILLVLAPGLTLAGSCVWSLVFAFTRYVSLSSLCAALSIPILAAILNRPFNLVVFTAILCAITTYKHRSNIQRLLVGKESKVRIKQYKDRP